MCTIALGPHVQRHSKGSSLPMSVFGITCQTSAIFIMVFKQVPNVQYFYWMENDFRIPLQWHCWYH